MGQRITPRSSDGFGLGARQEAPAGEAKDAIARARGWPIARKMSNNCRFSA